MYMNIHASMLEFYQEECIGRYVLAHCLDRIKQNVLEGLNVRILSSRMYRKICGLANV